MKKIGVWGDSITWGGYDRETGGWVTRLRRFCDGNYEFGDIYDGGPSVYNVGIWGDKVADVLKRFDVEHAARNPEMVILAVGMNDSSHQGHPKGTPLDEFEKNYRALIAKAKSKAQKLVLVGLTNVIDKHPRNRGYKNDTILPYAQVIEKIAHEHGVIVVNLFGMMTEEDVSLDGVHPLASGHKKIYQKVKEVIS